MYRFNVAEEQQFIEGELFKYNPCIGSIFFLFLDLFGSTEFKYNPCIGSINFVKARRVKEPDLNTTHVSVQSLTFCDRLSRESDLNTTHVSVQSRKYGHLKIALSSYNPIISMFCKVFSNRIGS